MQLTLRWYGHDDPVTLDRIRQIPVDGVVSALYDVPVGEAWKREDVERLRDEIGSAGLSLEVIESIPVHEDVKLGRSARDAYIDAFAESVEAVGAAGIRTVCYNFMTAFDWMRTDLERPLDDGTTVLCFEQEVLGHIDFSDGTGDLPGWATAYTGEELDELRTAYAAVAPEKLWDDLAYFLERVMPAAESSGVRLAIHPDDPPWDVAGFPRIITSGAALRRVTQLVDSPANGVTLCTGSLGADPAEAAGLPETVRSLAGRIHFVHGRNVTSTGERCFHESAHPFGDVDLPAVVRALRETGFDGPMRPDHGRMIWGEEGRPGYGLYDRALGAAYLRGLWDATAGLEAPVDEGRRH